MIRQQYLAVKTLVVRHSAFLCDQHSLLSAFIIESHSGVNRSVLPEEIVYLLTNIIFSGSKIFYGKHVARKYSFGIRVATEKFCEFDHVKVLL